MFANMSNQSSTGMPIRTEQEIVLPGDEPSRIEKFAKSQLDTLKERRASAKARDDAKKVEEIKQQEDDLKRSEAELIEKIEALSSKDLELDDREQIIVDIFDDEELVELLTPDLREKLERQLQDIDRIREAEFDSKSEGIGRIEGPKRKVGATAKKPIKVTQAELTSTKKQVSSSSSDTEFGADEAATAAVLV